MTAYQNVAPRARPTDTPHAYHFWYPRNSKRGGLHRSRCFYCTRTKHKDDRAYTWLRRSGYAFVAFWLGSLGSHTRPWKYRCFARAELETIETPLLHLYLSDTLIVVLIVTLLFDNCLDGFRRLATTRVRRVLCVSSGIFLLVWLVTVARSYIWANIPLQHAMDFGRDFVFFAILVPLFAATFTRARVRPGNPSLTGDSGSSSRR